MSKNRAIITLASKKDRDSVITGSIYKESTNTWLIELAPNTNLYLAEKSQWSVLSIDRGWPNEDGIYVPTVAAGDTFALLFIREFGEWSIVNSDGYLRDRSADSILEESFDNWGGLTRLVPEHE